MKKLLLSLSLVSGLMVSAQTKTVKNFTLTDIKGVEHDLYSYLDQGKTVYIDFSAAWCGPCWSFHNTHAFENLYKEHGPAGAPGVNENTTDDVVVLFVESEQSNTMDQINGQQGNTGNAYADNTQGNWAAATIYPLIDLPSGSAGNSVMSDFGISAFPTIYKVCPNRSAEKVVRGDADWFYSFVGDCPPAGTKEKDATILGFMGATRFCGPAKYTPRVEIQNLGTTEGITSLNISVRFNGQEVSTGSYNSSVAIEPYKTKVITCTGIDNFSGGELEVVVMIDGDMNPDNDSKVIMVEPAKEVSNHVLLSVGTDSYPDEVSWRIKSSSNITVPGTQVNAGDLTQGNTTYNYEYFMPEVGCYTMVAGDSYGDGTAKFDFFDVNGTVLYNDATLEQLKTVEIPFKVVTHLGLEDEAKANISIYPNPSAGKVYLKGDQLTNFNTVELRDQLGRTLVSWTIDGTQMDLDFGAVAEGNYFLVFKGDDAKFIEKVQVLK
ncbi:MAG: T9SS type A sorting domain-containing protein [Bacteroidetes bacterium]|nr:MAG: T9SS type A sorting domain-containing protein [Bacteroidota bacterium]